MELKSQVITRILLAHILFSFVSLDALQAEEFHVTTAVEFQNALTTARDNGEADTIWLAAGIYNTSENNYPFTYVTHEDYAITIKGETETSADDVILDGNGDNVVLSVEQYAFNVLVTIEGITVRNGIKGINFIIRDSNIILINNIIKDNNNSVSSSCGGGVYIDAMFAEITLRNNTIKDNKACDGGGLCTDFEFVDITLINNSITGNRAEGDSTTLGHGGGIYIDYLYPGYMEYKNITLTNNTITRNETSQNGGGIYLSCPEGIDSNIYNNIIYGNKGVEGGDIYNNSHIYAVTNVYNNNFHDKAGSPFTEDVDNIDDDPLFVNSEQGDYRLLPDSPCIDKGTADAPELPSTDFEGDSRIIGNAPDIGADEFDPSAPPTTTTTSLPQPCLSELIYGEYSEETELLREFRDNVLSKSPAGQEIIRLYYEWSPAIVQTMEEDEEFREEVRELIDGVLELIEETE